MKTLVVAIPMTLLALACDNGGNNDGGIFPDGGVQGGEPLITFSAAAIVEAATPDSLDGGVRTTSAPLSMGMRQGALTPDTLIARFKQDVYGDPATNGAGGFTMPGLLAMLDNRIGEINQAAAQKELHPCLDSVVDPRTIVTPDGRELAFYAQCHFAMEPQQFIIFGHTPDGGWNLYERGPAGEIVVAAREITLGEDQWELDATFAVTPDAQGQGSGVVLRVYADEAAGTVKWTGAYNARLCGVSYFADADHIWLEGSVNDEDQPAGGCSAEQKVVYHAADLSIDDTTPFDDSLVFSGDEFIRRNAVDAPVQADGYPGGGNVTLLGATSADAAADDLNFGPETVDALGSTAL